MLRARTEFSASLALLAALSGLTLAQRSLMNTSPYKGYSGIRVDPKSTRFLFYNDQTIAVTEVGPNRLLENCELIEVYNDKMRKMALKNLTAIISKPYSISFSDMMDLMERCQQLNTPSFLEQFHKERSDTGVSASILNGVLPGTKWCGAGDIAETYFDLGEDEKIDKCCRTHDLCPAKVRSFSSRYNLTNQDLYTKSHCKCDSQFYKCLKASKHPTANAMGNVYFNLLRVPCIQDKGETKIFQQAQYY